MAQRGPRPGGRHIALLEGYRPGDPMVRVFTYQAPWDGRPPEARCPPGTTAHQASA